MAYNINKFDGSLFAQVQEGEINQDSHITFIGKNYTSYGELQNENFMFLLENFARSNPPTSPVRGQLWYDTEGKKIRFYTGDRILNEDVWKIPSSVEYGEEPPIYNTGDLWYDTGVKKLKLRKETTWATVGPSTAPVYANVNERNATEPDPPVEGTIVLIKDDGTGSSKFQGYITDIGWVNLN